MILQLCVLRTITIDSLKLYTHAAPLLQAVGVSNYSKSLLEQTHAALRQRGIPLASNQIQYSLLHRQPELSGLLATCAQLNVQVLAYSPLAQGLLTGKYTSGNMPTGSGNGASQ
jgi:aryl-alcohol dehydrogenase-like predicted oxidoreductase